MWKKCSPTEYYNNIYSYFQYPLHSDNHLEVIMMGFNSQFPLCHEWNLQTEVYTSSSFDTSSQYIPA